MQQGGWWCKTLRDDAFLQSSPRAGAGSLLLLPGQEWHTQSLPVGSAWRCRARWHCLARRRTSPSLASSKTDSVKHHAKALVSPAALHPYAPGDTCCDSLCCNMFFPLEEYFFMVSSDPPCPLHWAHWARGLAHWRASAAQPGEPGPKDLRARPNTAPAAAARNKTVMGAPGQQRCSVAAEVQSAGKIVLV